MLEPVVAGEADFVLGSRVLGGAETDDSVRDVGVKVFSGLVRLLTGVRVTDTSSGLRAMRAEITAVVRQEQPQYQSSELLIGAIAHGYRVAERPTVMHKRTAGHSKKGGNVFYGARYARVVLRTWWRERRAARSRAAASPAVAVQRAGRMSAVTATPTAAPSRTSRSGSRRSASGSAPFMPVPARRGLRRGGRDRRLDGRQGRAARSSATSSHWGWIAASLPAVALWWILLANGWALLVEGRTTRHDVSVWCRTQALRFLPGGIWAPASRATVVHGSMAEKIAAVAGENLLALGAAVSIGGVAMALAGPVWWIALAPALLVPLVAARRLEGRIRVTPRRAVAGRGQLPRRLPRLRRGRRARAGRGLRLGRHPARRRRGLARLGGRASSSSSPRAASACASSSTSS